MMRRSFALGLAFLCLGLIMGARELRAAPPANDQCAGAEVIPGAGPFPYLSSITPNMHETTLTGDPPAPADCFGGVISNSAWYAFSPAATGLYTISTKFTATTMDTLMGIYTSPNGCAGPFTKYACNDDVGDLLSAITTNFIKGTTYYVVIWHVGGLPLEEDERSLQLKVTQVFPAPNDVCANAQEVPASGPFPYRTAPVDTYLANNQGDPVVTSSCDANKERSVWFKFRPSVGGNYIIATCKNNTVTTVDSTVLAVYQSPNGCGGTFTEARCNAGLCGDSAAVIMSLTPETDYYIAVWDKSPEPLPSETDIQLYIDRQTAPSVRTVGHSNVQPTQVTLHGIANPKALITRGYFQWGTTPAFGNVTPNSTLGNAVFYDFPFSQTLLDLPPGSTVHYRAVAFNSLGTTYGEPMTLTLPGPTISIMRQGAGVRLQFTGREGYNYEVQVSQDLRNWTRLGDATLLEFDEFEYFDPGPVSQGQRFYRIKL